MAERHPLALAREDHLMVADHRAAAQSRPGRSCPRCARRPVRRGHRRATRTADAPAPPPPPRPSSSAVPEGASTLCRWCISVISISQSVPRPRRRLAHQIGEQRDTERGVAGLEHCDRRSRRRRSRRAVPATGRWCRSQWGCAPPRAAARCTSSAPAIEKSTSTSAALASASGSSRESHPPASVAPSPSIRSAIARPCARRCRRYRGRSCGSSDGERGKGRHAAFLGTGPLPEETGWGHPSRYPHRLILELLAETKQIVPKRNFRLAPKMADFCGFMKECRGGCISPLH